MKKKITFEKEIEFPTMIGEITAISLEENMIWKDESNMEGDFLLSGKYKQTEASRIEEDFSYSIPTEIHLLEKIIPNTMKIDITDFTYEIIEENQLNCHIECLLEGEEQVELLEQEEVRECDGEIEEEKEEASPVLEKEEEESTLFFNMEEEKETYGTFVVYIVRQNESIQSIIERYNTTLEEVEKYNVLDDIVVGSKLMIPILHE